MNLKVFHSKSVSQFHKILHSYRHVILCSLFYSSHVVFNRRPMSRNVSAHELATELENDLLKLYGPVITGEELIKALGYVSKAAFRQSMVRKTVPVQLFEIEGRRGKFALTKDVACYLAERRFNSTI